MFSPRQVLESVRIPAGSSVADFGCGTGEFVKALPSIIGPNGKIYALDVQKDLVSRLASECEELGIQNVETLWADIELPGGSKLRDGLVDYVIVSNVLFQAESRSGLVAEVVRVLKSGGYAIFVDWKESFSNLGPHEKDIVSESEVIRLFTSAGCVQDRSLDVGGYHFGILFRKK